MQNNAKTQISEFFQILNPSSCSAGSSSASLVLFQTTYRCCCFQSVPSRQESFVFMPPNWLLPICAFLSGLLPHFSALKLACPQALPVQGMEHFSLVSKAELLLWFWPFCSWGPHPAFPSSHLCPTSSSSLAASALAFKPSCPRSSSPPTGISGLHSLLPFSHSLEASSASFLS